MQKTRVRPSPSLEKAKESNGTVNGE